MSPIAKSTDIPNHRRPKSNPKAGSIIQPRVAEGCGALPWELVPKNPPTLSGSAGRTQRVSRYSGSFPLATRGLSIDPVPIQNRNPLQRFSRREHHFLARLAFWAARSCRAFSTGRRPPSRSKISTRPASFSGEEACEPWRHNLPSSTSAQTHRCICKTRKSPGSPRRSRAAIAFVRD